MSQHTGLDASSIRIRIMSYGNHPNMWQSVRRWRHVLLENLYKFSISQASLVTDFTKIERLLWNEGQGNSRREAIPLSQILNVLIETHFA